MLMNSVKGIVTRARRKKSYVVHNMVVRQTRVQKESGATRALNQGLFAVFN